MSKIRAVRLININYNHDAIRISDETMHFNGESTLISLQNGGGKSVLVQMLCAPFVQKRFRNVKDRPFAGYFRTPQPSFILVEWQLEQGGGCLLTGMMVRKSQELDAGEELEIINFLSEYRAPCTEDIHHLPVVEKTRTEVRLKSYAACRQLFETLRRQPQKKFLSYDMNSAAQAKQYFTKLMEYGIDYREWQNIIRKVNEEESGLSKLFSDCKDEKGLVEKWFLDAIESKLNKEQNRMGEFRSILEKYVRLYQGNRSKIERKAKIQHFEEEALKIEERAEAYGRSSKERSARSSTSAIRRGTTRKPLRARLCGSACERRRSAWRRARKSAPPGRSGGSCCSLPSSRKDSRKSRRSWKRSCSSWMSAAMRSASWGRSATTSAIGCACTTSSRSGQRSSA